MKRFFVVIVLTLTGLSPLAQATEGRTGKHIDDPRRILPVDAVWRRTTEEKLAAFERTAEIKILVQFHEKSPSPEEDKVPGAYMHALAARLGVETRGVLVVYFADDPDWRIWIGDELTPLFVGHAGTAKELTASGAIHDTKEALLAAAHAKSEAAFAALEKDAPPGQSPAPAQRIRLNADALLDGLITKFTTPATAAG